MPRIRIALLALLFVALAVAPLAAVAQEATPASEADAALLNAAAGQLLRGRYIAALVGVSQLYISQEGDESAPACWILQISRLRVKSPWISAQRGRPAPTSPSLTSASVMTARRENIRGHFQMAISCTWVPKVNGIGASLSGSDRERVGCRVERHGRSSRGTRAPNWISAHIARSLALGRRAMVWFSCRSRLNLLTLAADPGPGRA